MATTTTIAPAAAAAFAAHSKHIAAHEAKPHPQPLDECTVTEAFGSWAYPKIVAGLRSDNPVICAKSVVAARDLLVAPERHILCIAAGITPALRDLISTREAAPAGTAAAAAAAGATAPVDEALQAAAATTLQALVSKEVGCRDALQHGCLPPLLQLLKQPSAAVRDAAYGALTAASLFQSWRAALTREGALAALLLAAQEEAPHRAAQALQLLHACAQARNNQEALTQLIAVQQAVPKLCAMLAGSSLAGTSASSLPEPVRLGVVKLLASLAATHADARVQAVECGSVPELLAHLVSPSADMAAAGAGALMMLTLAKEGKIALHQAGGLAVCLGVLDGQLQQRQDTGGMQEPLATNTLQAVTNAAEYGPCNVALQRSPQLQVVAALARSDAAAPPLVRAAAGQALRMAGGDRDGDSAAAGSASAAGR